LTDQLVGAAVSTDCVYADITGDSSSDVDRNGHHRDGDIISEDHHLDHYHTAGITRSHHQPHQSTTTGRHHRRTALEQTLAVSISLSAFMHKIH